MGDATHYHGSKGPVAIADMNVHHLASARDKLVRERKDDSRDAEIAAMSARLSAEAEAYAESQVSE